MRQGRISIKASEGKYFCLRDILCPCKSRKGHFELEEFPLKGNTTARDDGGGRDALARGLPLQQGAPSDGGGNAKRNFSESCSNTLSV